MKTMDRAAAKVGLDVHRRFSKVTARDATGKIVGRERLEHEDRQALQERLGAWAKGTPVVLEASFGLAGRKSGGPTPKLTDSQKRKLRQWIVGKDPMRWGFDFGLWTRR